MANENDSLDGMVNEIMQTFKAQLLETMKRAMIASLPKFETPAAPAAPAAPVKRGPIPRSERSPVPQEWQNATILPFVPLDLVSRGRPNPSLLPVRSDDRYRAADVVKGLSVKLTTGSVYPLQARIQCRDTVPGPETTVSAADVISAVLATPGQTVWRRSGSDAIVCGSPGAVPVTVNLGGRVLSVVCYFSGA